MTSKELAYLLDKLRKISSNLDRPCNLVQYAQIHFSGNVPRVNEMPTLDEYELCDDPEQYIKDEENKARDEIDKKNRNAKITIIILYIGLLAYFLWGLKNDGLFIGMVWLIFCIPTIVDIYYEKKKDEAKKSAAIGFKERYKLYQDRVLAYSYWLNVRDINLWDSLDGHQFEDAVANLFRRKGYKAQVSPPGGDGGIDIVLYRDGEDPIAVQCKAHKSPVAPAIARDLYGTMIANNFTCGMIISKSGFTSGTLNFVMGLPIQLLDINDLIQMSREL